MNEAFEGEKGKSFYIQLDPSCLRILSFILRHFEHRSLDNMSGGGAAMDTGAGPAETQGGMFPATGFVEHL